MKKTSTIKKAQMGAALPSKKIGVSGSLRKFKPQGPKSSKGSVYEGYTLPEFTVKAPKAKAGKSLGMESVKARYDNNPGVTRADIIVAAKKKAKYGAKVAPKKRIKKAQDGTMLPEVTKKATSLRPMEIALGDDRKMSIDTVGYKSPARMRNETFNYTVSDKSGKNIRQGKLQSGPGESRVDIVSRMAKDLESGKMKRPTFKSGGKMTAKKGASVKKSSMGKCKYGC
jgi:hypothetical protein